MLRHLTKGAQFSLLVWKSSTKRSFLRNERKQKNKLNLEIWEFAAFEVDFNNNKAFIVDAKHRFKETSTTKRLLEHKITGGRQIMEIIFGGRCLRCASKLIPHFTRANIYSFITSRYLVNKKKKNAV